MTESLIIFLYGVLVGAFLAAPKWPDGLNPITGEWDR